MENNGGAKLEITKLRKAPPLLVNAPYHWSSGAIVVALLNAGQDTINAVKRAILGLAALLVAVQQMQDVDHPLIGAIAR